MRQPSDGSDVAVLVIAYRRPSLVELQLDGLSIVRPRTLVVACDLPPSGDRTDAQRIRAGFQDGVSWPCDITFDVASEHLGLNRRVTSAIDLVLELSDQAIILEDDCVPHPHFFAFAARLLDRYRNDHRVRMIAGGRPLSAPRWGQASYYFSRYPFIWGWATWADRWNEACFDARSWTSADEQLMRKHFAGDELDYWTRMTSKSVQGRGSWDYQWFHAMLEKDGLCAVPNMNLVTNVGFGEGATHTTDALDYGARSVPSTSMDRSMTHPLLVERHDASDRQAFREVFLRERNATDQEPGLAC